MKLQLHGQCMRLRIEEAELADLLDAGEAANLTRFPDAIFAQSLMLTDEPEAKLHVSSGNLRVQLPRGAVEAYCTRLPCREGLEFHIAADGIDALRLVFEVDVRDSVRRRGPPARSPRAA